MRLVHCRAGSTPASLRRPLRHHGRGSNFPPTPPRTLTRPAAAANDAANDGNEEEATDAGADADDEGLVVVDPGADFGEVGGADALTLEMNVSIRMGRGRDDLRLSIFLHHHKLCRPGSSVACCSIGRDQIEGKRRRVCSLDDYRRKCRCSL